MDTNKMREMRDAFERTNSRDHRRQPPKGNNYIDPMAQADWESFQKGWLASREALVVGLPIDVSGGLYRLALEDCGRCIEAQGLKVTP
ncbi:hypothetical protein ACLEJW_09155 [Pseudomonas sp. SMSB3]|uniref:hypothetical protein n=1 Tax=Pseudomonas sp. SMSB3 TaxID=3390196 RepID=UPI003F839DD3